MSIGVSIYYILTDEDNLKLRYGYSGADINKEYDKNLLLKYDGIIEILKESLVNKDVLDAFKDIDIKIINECEYECHHSRVNNGNMTIGFFAMKVIFKIFKEYKELGSIPQKGTVVY